MITHIRDGYRVDAALKTTIEVESDNLLYEYLVGEHFINSMSIFPRFIKTYGLFIIQAIKKLRRSSMTTMTRCKSRDQDAEKLAAREIDLNESI
jgi:hypothetical protein